MSLCFQEGDGQSSFSGEDERRLWGRMASACVPCWSCRRSRTHASSAVISLFSPPFFFSFISALLLPITVCWFLAARRGRCRGAFPLRARRLAASHVSSLIGLTIYPRFLSALLCLGWSSELLLSIFAPQFVSRYTPSSVATFLRARFSTVYRLFLPYIWSESFVGLILCKDASTYLYL